RARIGVRVHGDLPERAIPGGVAVGIGQHAVHVEADQRRPIRLAGAHDPQVHGTGVRRTVHAPDRTRLGVSCDAGEVARPAGDLGRAVGSHQAGIAAAVAWYAGDAEQGAGRGHAGAG